MELSFLHFIGFCLLFCRFSVIADDITSNLHYYETLKKVDINSRVRRSTDPHPGSHVHEIWFTAFGRTFHVYVKQTKVVSDDFVANFVESDGSKTPLEIDTGNFYTGSLKGDLDSNVQLHWERSNLHATIKYSDDILYVEPSWRHISRSDNHSMIVYKHSDLKWKPEEFSAGKRESFCEMKDLRNNDGEQLDDEIKLFPNLGHSRQKRQTYQYVGTHTMCSLFVVADYRFFEAIGSKDKRVTGEYLIGMIGRVNDIYTKTQWGEGVTGLGFEIKEMLIHDKYEDDPGNHYNMANRPADMDAVLDWFGEDSKKLTQFCLGHLFTYQQFPGKLGLAYIGSWRFTDPGGLCSFPAYVSSGKKIAVNTGVSTFQNPGGSRALAAQATITVAHGHNWGSEHDPDSDECAPPSTNSGKYIMYYRATSGYEANNQIFSPCSKRFIFKVVMKKGYDCFEEKTAGGRGVCGNGRLDPGEECDGGYEGDFCCTDDCRLRLGAKCSDMNYACCQNCNTAPAGTRCYEAGDKDFDCLGVSNCTGSSFTCPDPIKKTDTPCHDDGTCKDGVCKDVCEAIGRKSCLCAGAESCRKCCINLNGKCEATTRGGSYVYHAQGRPCTDGFCDGQGSCKESTPPLIKRLFTILDYFSVDKIAKAMKDNLVWIILLFSAILWIIAIIIIERYDKKKYEEDRRTVEIMNPASERGRRVNLGSSNDVQFLGTRHLKPRLRGQRGRATLVDEDSAREAGF